MTTPYAYCTDEDVAVRATSDFATLCPRDQALCRGTDGTFAAASPWTLSSPSADLSAVQPGMVVQLTAPTSAFRPPGELLAVDSGGVGALTLRRRGLDPGEGLPPGQGGLAGVAFQVATVAPQIRMASYDLDRRYGVNDLVMGRRHADLFDPAELREATVLTVLYKLYQDRSARATGVSGQFASGDTFEAKARWTRAELEELLARVAVHWRPCVPGGTTPIGAPTTRFGLRISR